MAKKSEEKVKRGRTAEGRSRRPQRRLSSFRLCVCVCVIHFAVYAWVVNFVNGCGLSMSGDGHVDLSLRKKINEPEGHFEEKRGRKWPFKGMKRVVWERKTPMSAEKDDGMHSTGEGGKGNEIKASTNKMTDFDQKSIPTVVSNCLFLRGLFSKTNRSPLASCNLALRGPTCE